MTKPDGIPWVVLDTNILVSSLLSDGPPALILDRVAGGKSGPAMMTVFFNSMMPPGLQMQF